MDGCMAPKTLCSIVQPLPDAGETELEMLKASTTLKRTLFCFCTCRPIFVPKEKNLRNFSGTLLK